MRRVHNGFGDILCQARHADSEPGIEEPARPRLAQVDLDIHGIVRWQHDIFLRGHEPQRSDVAGRPGTCKQLLGGRVRFGRDYFMAVTTRRRQSDVDDAVIATLGTWVAVDSGVGRTRVNDFFELGHDSFLSFEFRSEQPSDWCVDHRAGSNRNVAFHLLAKNALVVKEFYVSCVYRVKADFVGARISAAD
jgi:hypothetical protein